MRITATQRDAVCQQTCVSDFAQHHLNNASELLTARPVLASPFRIEAGLAGRLRHLTWLPPSEASQPLQRSSELSFLFSRLADVTCLLQIALQDRDRLSPA